MNRVKRCLALVVVAVFVTVGVASQASADSYPGLVYGRATWRGYFDNHVETSGTVVLPPKRNSTQAIPNSVNTVSELIALLKGDYNAGGSRKTGAAFIVNTMLGRDARRPQASRTIRAADWAEVTDRLNDRQAAHKINWTGNASGHINSYYQESHNDDAFYKEYRNEKGIVVRDDNNRIVYQIIRRCANPIGDSTGLPQANQWSVGEDSYIQKANAQGNPVGNFGTSVTNAKPGDRYFFRHRFYNRGPDTIDQNIVTWRSFQYPSVTNNNANRATGGNGVVRNGTIRTIVGSTGLITTADTGKQWCSQAFADTTAYDDPDTLIGKKMCVSVGYSYNLTPTIEVGGGQQVNVEQNATGTAVDYSVQNAGPSRSHATTQQLIRFEVAPSAPLSSATDKSPNNNTPPCPTHASRPGVSNCTVINQSGGHLFDVGTTPAGRYLHDTGNIPIGTRICFVLSVSAPTQNANPSWAHSQPACVVVIKKPKIQVQGGDLWVGRQFVDDATTRNPGNIATGTSTIAGKTYGSWAEYGVFATGNVVGMASGAALASGLPQAQAVAAQINQLTFANRPTYGNYTTNPDRIPDYIATYATNGAAAPATLNLAAVNGSYKTARDVTLQAGGPIQKGKNIVIHAHNVTINDTIAYADTYGSLNDIPRVIIIADGDIYLSPNVTRIDSWLIAKGTLYTCNQQALLTINVCNKQLTINGPVAAKEVSLRRTYGSETDQGRDAPAEVFNLRPDALLKAYQDALDRGRAQTVYQVELPPRY